MHVAYGRGSVLLRRGDEIPREVVIWGFSSPLTVHCNAFAAKGIIQSPIASCSRRDHSVAAAFAANGIGREVDDGSAQRGRSVIYDCSVWFCFIHHKDAVICVLAHTYDRRYNVLLESRKVRI